VFGSGTQSQAKVPLNGDEATTLKPVTQDSIKGALPVGNLTLTPDLAEVRWDDPVAHTQSDKGEAFLIITGKVKNNSPDAVYYFEQKQATLTLPSGEKETADTFTTKDGSSIDGTKSSEFRLVFTVTDPWPGDYTLDFAAAWGTDNDVTAPSLALVKATTAPRDDAGQHPRHHQEVARRPGRTPPPEPSDASTGPRTHRGPVPRPSAVRARARRAQPRGPTRPRVRLGSLPGRASWPKSGQACARQRRGSKPQQRLGDGRHAQGEPVSPSRAHQLQPHGQPGGRAPRRERWPAGTGGRSRPTRAGTAPIGDFFTSTTRWSSVFGVGYRPRG
jgi:hypothetical protein